MSDSEMRKFKRKRTTERTKGTRFITAINESTENTPQDDYEHYRGRLQETLDQLVRLDDANQDLLEEWENTVEWRRARSTLILPSERFQRPTRKLEED